MNEEIPHIIATCSKCGFRFDILFGVACPRCRAEAVREAFKPVDALRTALGMGVRLHGKLADPEYMRGKGWGEEDWTEEVPKGCRMPKDEADQIYELRRLFRL